MRRRINYLFIFVIVVLLAVVVFVDNDSLNSLFIDYSDLVVNEVNVLNVDYSKVIYQDTNVTSVANTNPSGGANPSEGTNSNGGTNVVPLGNSAVASGNWIWPTDQGYTITTYYSAGHKAIDIYQGYGSNIYAANNGVVVSVKGGCIPGNLACNGRGGNYVVINHNSSNYYTVYMHLKDIRVNVGDVVGRGQVIGTMGNTGNVIPVPTSSAPYLGTHLHFCLYVGQPFNGGYAVNPMGLY